MADYFNKLKSFLFEIGYEIVSEDKSQKLVVISDPDEGINNMILDCEDELLIVEQFIFNVTDDLDVYKSLLQMNRNFVHGAFVLDDSGQKVLFRDTLQLENLDLNELEATIKSLSLFLAEHAQELIQISKKIEN
jgi:hypothetical protein